jgi:hypothetical protein
MLKNGKEHGYMTVVQGFAVFGGMVSKYYSLDWDNFRLPPET